MTNIDLYKPDFLVLENNDDLDKLELRLAKEEEDTLKEILTLEEQIKNNNNRSFIKDLLDAAKKGTLQYLDSMTDTNDSISSHKRSSDVSQWDDTEIKPINTSANKEESEAFKARTMKDANSSAIDINNVSTDGMSAAGKKAFEKYAEIYSQRTKSLTQLSTEDNQIKRSDPKTNMETLSGLRGYRIGPVVEMPNPQQAKQEYEEYLKNNPNGKAASVWLYDQNMNEFDTRLAKELGFKSISEAREWRKKNKLTVHEGPDGMFMVPNDVHSAARHNGYRTLITNFIAGKTTREELNDYINKEKIEYVKHEATERGIRAVKGIGMSAIKDVLKCGIVVICEETYSEFQNETNDKLVDRMIRILKKSWEHVKNKCSEILKNLWSNIKGSILSEILTAINDFFLGTFKNIFKIVRQMWSSIKNALKIIFSKDNSISLAERMFEASKILSAGVVSLIGFSLNELIEKALTSIGVPFASFISECLSGLFAGIMSAIVMMLFDRFKQKFLAEDPYVRTLQLRSKCLAIESAKLSIDSLRLDRKMYETYNFMGQVFGQIAVVRGHIAEQQILDQQHNRNFNSLLDQQFERTRTLEDMKNKYINDNDF